ncbi:MAG: lamin tail domain-containing protein [Saprospiraceae bacterium]|nr:lamin tail domain-containing protein [Saprospiraceae bacterium]
MPAIPKAFIPGPPSTENWVFTYRFNIPGFYRYDSELYENVGTKGTIEVLPKIKTNLVITEIMYDDPGSMDSLEFVEIVNVGEKPLNLNYFAFQSKEINYMFPNYLLNNNETLILARYPDAIKKYFGIDAIAWGAGSLKNLDNLTLKNFFGQIIDKVDYWYNSPWPIQAAGYGKSINLCRPDLDNNVAANWQESPISAGFKVEGKTIYANPGKPNYCKYDIQDINKINADGTLVYDDLGVKVYGTIHGVNLNKGGLEFTIIDDKKDGISAYSLSDNFGYVVKEGNKLTAIGRTNQVNGLARIDLDEIIYTPLTGQIATPAVVEELNEGTESQIVTIKNVSLVNPADWGEGSSGFNVEVSNGVKNFIIRIDDDVDLFNLKFPEGTFNITGIGSQHDTISPLLDGYQLCPRYVADIDPYISGKYNRYPVGLITTTNSQGVADSLGIKCEIEGIVYGINFNPNGLSFTLIDSYNDGINIYLQNKNLGYTVLEGDEIRVKGKVDQYNGLIKMIPDKIEIISPDNNLNLPTTTTVLNESTESQLIEIRNVTWVNPADWKGNGTSFNISMKNNIGIFTVTIDSNTELAKSPLPSGGIFTLRGFGSQFDTQKPYLESYRIVPRYLSDFHLFSGIAGTYENGNSSVEIYPNPSKKVISISYHDRAFDYISIFDISGNLLKKIAASAEKQTLDVSDLVPGVYYLFFTGSDFTESKKVVIIE